MQLHTKNRMTPQFNDLLIRLNELHHRYTRCVADLAEYERDPFTSFDVAKWSKLNDALLAEINKLTKELYTLTVAVST
jgi:hypothetical protein